MGASDMIGYSYWTASYYGCRLVVGDGWIPPARRRWEMVTRIDDRVRLSRRELDDWIHREAKRRLSMSGDEFKRRLKAGTLPDSSAVRDIRVLAELDS